MNYNEFNKFLMQIWIPNYDQNYIPFRNRISFDKSYNTLKLVWLWIYQLYKI